MTRENLVCVAATAASAALFFFGTGLRPVAAVGWLAPLPILLLAPRRRAKTAAASAFTASLLGSTNSWNHFLRSLSIPLPAALVIVLGSAAMFTAATLAFRALFANGRPSLAGTLAAVRGHDFTRSSTVDKNRRIAALARTERHWAVDVATPAG